MGLDSKSERDIYHTSRVEEDKAQKGKRNCGEFTATENSRYYVASTGQAITESFPFPFPTLCIHKVIHCLEETEQASTQMLKNSFGLFHLVYVYIGFAWLSRRECGLDPFTPLIWVWLLAADSLSSLVFQVSYLNNHPFYALRLSNKSNMRDSESHRMECSFPGNYASFRTWQKSFRH